MTYRLAAVALLGACLTLPLLAACDRGESRPASLADARLPVRLTPAEREHLREGMRIYLESTRGIIDALAEHKLILVGEHARKAGTTGLRGASLWTVATLPPEFVLLGADTHQKFDALSLAAAASAVSKHEVLQRLQDILANCTACHDTYRVAPDRR